MSEWIRKGLDGSTLDVDDVPKWDGTKWVPGTASGGGGPATVRAASSGDAPLTNMDAGATLDGLTLAEDDRILLKNQDDATENGIYTVLAAGTPPRAADLDTGASAHLVSVLVEEGDRQLGTEWVCKAPPGSDTVGTDALPWARTSALATSPSAGEWRAQISAGAPSTGIVRFSTDTKASIVTVDLAFTPTVGGTYRSAEGMIGIGSVLRFQHVVDSEDSLNLLVTDLSIATNGWSATVDVLGQTGPADIVNTYHYSLVVVGGAKTPVILYENASIAATDSATARLPPGDFTSRPVGHYKVAFRCEVTAITGGTLTLTLEQSVANARKVVTATSNGVLEFDMVLDITSAGPVVVKHQMSTGETATMTDVALMLEPIGKIDW